jgi:hypothetical protein
MTALCRADLATFATLVRQQDLIDLQRRQAHTWYGADWPTLAIDSHRHVSMSKRFRLAAFEIVPIRRSDQLGADNIDRSRLWCSGELEINLRRERLGHLKARVSFLLS